MAWYTEQNSGWYQNYYLEIVIISENPLCLVLLLEPITFEWFETDLEDWSIIQITLSLLYKASAFTK